MRAGFEAAAATDAAGQGVALLLRFLAFGRACAQVIGAVDGHPGLDALEVVEQPAAIDPEIAHEWELGHGFERDRLAVGADLVDEGAAALA